MPIAAGEMKEIRVYGSYASCAQYQILILVKRCSTKMNDFVYKYTDASIECEMGFCGMDQ